MCEAFVLISKEIPNAKERNSFLAYLLSSHKQEWVGNDISQIVGDPGLLLKLLEIIPESNPQQQAALVAAKQKMVHIMMLFVHVTKRLVVSSGDSQIQLLLAEYLLEMVPNVMNLIRTLHLLYAPQTQQLIDEKNREHLFYVGIDEEERLLGNNCFNASALSDTQLRVYHIHRAIRSIRTHAYSLMGFACQLCDKGAQFWSNPQMFNLLGNSVFSHLDDMDNKDTKALLSFVSSFILYCPEGLYDSLLSNVLVPYSANLYKRLDAQWCQLLAPERAARVMSDEQLRKETVYEKILIELTREVITVFSDLMSGLRKAKDKPAGAPNATCKYLLRNDNVIGMWIMIAIRMVALPDTICVNKSTLFLQNLIPYLNNNKKLNVLLCGDLLQSSIKSLMMHKEEMHQQLINFIADIYVYYFNNDLEMLKNIMLNLPHADISKVNALNKNVKKEMAPFIQVNGANVCNAKTSKKVRAHMKQFLNPICGKYSGEFKSTKSIVSISNGNNERMKSADKKAKESFLDDLSVSYLSTMFQ
ncbi:hypothetical protein AKO1_010060 [Acrasis kona]|uniref:Exportin-5 C-terminal domain-containing protein n=1 Tax=Acrasis kona TaxID=1008807 RepID=A0AAW2ZR40_9EUKA